jgi:hypothetical protein
MSGIARSRWLWIELETPATTAGPGVTSRFAQIRVDITSNGTREPALRSLDGMFRRDPDGRRVSEVRIAWHAACSA